MRETTESVRTAISSRFSITERVEQIFALCLTVSLQSLLDNLLLLIGQALDAFGLRPGLRVWNVFSDDGVDLGNIPAQCCFDHGCHSAPLQH